MCHRGALKFARRLGQMFRLTYPKANPDDSQTADIIMSDIHRSAVFFYLSVFHLQSIL